LSSVRIIRNVPGHLATKIGLGGATAEISEGELEAEAKCLVETVYPAYPAN